MVTFAETKHYKGKKKLVLGLWIGRFRHFCTSSAIAISLPGGVGGWGGGWEEPDVLFGSSEI